MKKITPIASLLLGAGLLALVTWKWNVAVAAWLAPVFLMHFFRGRRGFLATLPAVALLWVVSYANKAGAWDMDPLLEVAVGGIALLPLVAALYLDRALFHRLPVFWATLVFPAAFVSLDYAISFLPFGTVFSFAVTQFYIEPLVQAAALTGIWGIEFLVLWTAPVVNSLWENGFESLKTRIPAAVFTFCLAAVFVVGGLRVVIDRPVSTSVRIAGVAVPHAHDYWGEIIDQGTPRDRVSAFAPEIQELEDQLFQESENAVRSGAKVIFWSEADAFILPGGKDAFLRRARDFALQHQVYLMSAFQVLRYGDTSGYNGLALITPQGEVAYEYEKTMSWYATTSDGVLHSADTPYGRIGAAICFDMDFPALIQQAARQDVDILLVPAFDTYPTRVYHSEVGLLRGVEGGFSVMRMVNAGTSMAVDYRGRLLASQDFFTAASPILVADLPTRGVNTLYGRLGDGFAWLCIALAAGSLARAFIRSGVRQVTPG